MGSTPKPLHIQISKELYETQREQWDTLVQQGHVIQVVLEPIPDLYLAPYAMRVTADMLTQLPKGVELLIKGARALRYGPHGKDPEGWKKGGKRVSNTTKGKRKNSKKQTETTDDAQPATPDGTGRPTTESTDGPCEASITERDDQACGA